ncbi:hypothetical protein B0H17DRAFT_917387 [Mycena rosella]|uniref:NmrA-like domain-containing protein n=1 Tax=Mycena rosella TaxID=1033263 RepID=A0AAD7MAV1_MYCRO|nr:hypothetical protein B0H17DRAFT_917387 [Mycena rosella]
MSLSRIVSVFGATGLQGSAVIRALLKDGTFTPRAISRDPTSEAALKLKASGVEVVKGDPLNKASLLSALHGSEAVFAVRELGCFSSLHQGPNELVQGKNMIDAAKEVSVKFFVFSSLPSITDLSGGKYKNCLHFDHKVVLDDYLRASGLACASLLPGSFLENYWKCLTQIATGYDYSVPIITANTRQAFTWAEREVPAVTLALLKNYTEPSKNISGNSYPIVNAIMTFAELASMTGEALGAEMTFTTAPPLGIPAVDDVYKANGEFGALYNSTPVPNPDLVALGVTLGAIEDFLETEVKPRFRK